MAASKARTISVQPDTALLLARLAKRWNVTKAEALRLALRAAAPDEPLSERENRARLAAFKRFQVSMNLTPAAARRWQRELRANRRATNPVPKTRRK
jgi:hypothetical protein